MPTESSRDLEDQLKKALEECASLKEENVRLKKLLEFIENLDSIPIIVAKSNDHQNSTVGSSKWNSTG